MTLPFFKAVITHSVKNSSKGVELKFMLGIKMLSDLFKFFTLKVNKLSAFFTFAMKAGFVLLMNGHSHILKARAASAFKYILIEQSFVHKLLQLAVYG